MKVMDLFPDAPTVGGIQVVPKPSSFPDALDAPTVAKSATITPFPDVADVIFAPTGGSDLVAALFVGTALLLGPDFLLAPAGLVSSRGIRPGYALEGVVGELATPDAQWLRDRREQLAADAPLTVRLAVWCAFVAAGLLVERLLLVALEDAGFVISAGVCACIGGGLLEVIRPPLPTREERDRGAMLKDEFLVFATDRLARGGRCHERDIVAAFRRYADMERSVDGQSLPDSEIADLARAWNGSMGRPGERTSTGFWKGISLAEGEE